MSASTKKRGKTVGKKRKSKAPTHKKSKDKPKKQAARAVPSKDKPKKTKPKKVERKAPTRKQERKEEEVVEQQKKKKVAPKKTIIKPERVELGPPPTATVEVRHIDSLQERAARGFSFGELSSAGVPLNAAKREGLSFDIRRRSVVDGNVEVLKGWFKSPEQVSDRDAAASDKGEKEPVEVAAASDSDE